MRLVHSPGQLRTNMPVAPSLIVTLKYVDPTFMYGNFGNFDWSTRFRLNSVFDPDPHTISGGTISYFNQYAALYTRYRVLSVRYKVVASNLMAEPVIFTVAPSKEDLGDNFAEIQQLAEINKGVTQLLGANGSMNRSTVTRNIDLAKFSGSPSYLTDDTTAARVDTNPSVQWYLNVGMTSNILMSASSFGVRTELYYTVVFWQPKTETPVVFNSKKALADNDRLCAPVDTYQERPVNIANRGVRRLPPDNRSQSQDRSACPSADRFSPSC